MSILDGKKIGFALTSSYCTFAPIILELEKLIKYNTNIYPIMSSKIQEINTRFGKGLDFIKKVENITNNKVTQTILEAERFGPQEKLDICVIAPCTGNTLAKIANGITDTPVLMAAKATMRNNRPLVLLIATNDGLGFNLKNIGSLINSKNIYLVPMGQDDYINKFNSLVGKSELLIPTIEYALRGEQIQPILISYP